MNEPSLFDPPAVEAARQDGIDRAGNTAGDDWKTQAYEQVEWLARAYPDFTSDELIVRLELFDITPPNGMAMGAVFQKAARDGVIRKTGELRRTKIPTRHRDLTVWTAA